MAKCDKCGGDLPTPEELQKMNWKVFDEMEPTAMRDGRTLHRKCAQEEAAGLLRSEG